MKENTENNNNPALEELLQVLNQEVINSLLNGQYQITEVRDLVNTGGKWDYVYYICLHRKINLSIVLPGNATDIRLINLPYIIVDLIFWI